MRTFSVAVVLLSVACDGHTGPRPTDLTGEWQFSDSTTATSPIGPITCTAAALLNLVQDGVTLSVMTSSGTRTCGTNAIPWSLSIVDGTLSGRSVSLKNVSCTFTGTLSGDPPDRMDGQESCYEIHPGVGLTFIGPWQATVTSSR
jgi:hypothetical protein